jgi:hypothetical protein
MLSRHACLACFFSSLAALAGCSLVRTPILPTEDAGDAGPDASLDAQDGGALDGGDAGMDAPLMDVPTDDVPTDDAPGDDAGNDTGLDDAGFDAPSDAGSDAPSDTGVDAPLDGGTDAPIDAPGCVPTCSGPMTLSDCSSSVEVLCELGCLDAPTPHCAVMVPANVETAYPRVALSAASVVVNDLHVIDTTTCGWAPTTGARFSGTNVTMDGGGEACLFVLGSLDVTAAGVLGAFGTRPLIIVSRGNVNIAGLVSVDSARSLADGSGPIVGAGSGTGGSAGGNGTGTVTGRSSGGGGAGFGGAGASGGSAAGGSTAGAGGGAGSPTLLPLRGGAAGGTGAGPTASAGGAGGGAIQITSLARLSFSGYLGAGGAGGAGGDGVFLSAAAGGGGGSGGGILLEAMDLILTGGLVNIAGGGGGGSGCSGVGSVAGGDGADGSDVPSARAAGGTSCMGGQSGGAGSGGTAAAGAAGGSGFESGGGGAGAGQVVFRTPLGLILPGTTAFNPTVGAASGRYVVSDISRR